MQTEKIYCKKDINLLTHTYICMYTLALTHTYMYIVGINIVCNCNQEGTLFYILQQQKKEGKWKLFIFLHIS